MVGLRYEFRVHNHLGCNDRLCRQYPFICRYGGLLVVSFLLRKTMVVLTRWTRVNFKKLDHVIRLVRPRFTQVVRFLQLLRYDLRMPRYSRRSQNGCQIHCYPFRILDPALPNCHRHMFPCTARYRGCIKQPRPALLHHFGWRHYGPHCLAIPDCKPWRPWKLLA